MTTPSGPGMTNPAPRENPEPGRCSFFLSGRKARFCRSLAVTGQRFCGNHLHVGDPGAAAAGPQRVPCPLDSRHTVLAADLEVHVSKRCPALREALRERAQPHFHEDVNAGSDSEPELPQPPPPQPPHLPSSAPKVVVAAAGVSNTGPVGATAANSTAATTAAAAGGMPAGAASTPPSEVLGAAAAAAGGLLPSLGPFAKGRAAQRAALARGLGEGAFRQLLVRLDSAHAAVCGPSASPPPLSVLRPPECEGLLGAPSQLRPCDPKHSLQQASIVGNMQRIGLISPGPRGGSDVAVVELGAGKGYLGAALAECCGVQRLVATDIKAGLKLKADRRVRHIVFGRYRVDLKDYVPAATPELASAPPGTPWVAVAKHLCGAATDFGLRACLRDHRQTRGSAAAVAAAEAAAAVAVADAALAGAAAGNVDLGAGAARKRRRGGAGKEDAAGAQPGAATLPPPPSHHPPPSEPPPPPPPPHADADADGVRSRADPGGGAGVGAAADGDGDGGGSGGDTDAGVGSEAGVVAAAADGTAAGSGGGAVLRGLAIAPCCHHRCGWRAYTGKSLFRRMGLSATDFELISWMTGWALCGHDTPAGAPGGAGGGSDDDDDDDGNADSGDACGDGDGEGCCGRCCADGVEGADRRGERGQAGATANDGGGGGGDPNVSDVEGRGPEAPTAAAADACDGAAAGASSNARLNSFDPVLRLPRSQRMAVGLKCKQLIDAGRLDWLQRRFQSAELVSYMGPEVTGENRLLLAVGPLPPPLVAEAAMTVMAGRDGSGGAAAAGGVRAVAA